MSQFGSLVFLFWAFVRSGGPSPSSIRSWPEFNHIWSVIGSAKKELSLCHLGLPSSDLSFHMVNPLVLLSRDKHTFGRGLHCILVLTSVQESINHQSTDLNPLTLLRSTQISLQIQSQPMFRFFDTNGRGLHSYRDSTLGLGLCGDPLQILRKISSAPSPDAPLPPSSSFMERSFSPSSSSRERALLSSVVMAIVLALRAFVDHLVVIGLKKVAFTSTFLQSSDFRNFVHSELVSGSLVNGLDLVLTSDKVFISTNTFLDSWNLVSPLKSKDFTSKFCISSASISLLACLSFNFVVAFYFASPTVWVWYSSSYMECNQV